MDLVVGADGSVELAVDAVVDAVDEVGLAFEGVEIAQGGVVAA